MGQCPGLIWCCKITVTNSRKERTNHRWMDLFISWELILHLRSYRVCPVHRPLYWNNNSRVVPWFSAPPWAVDQTHIHNAKDLLWDLNTKQSKDKTVVPWILAGSNNRWNYHQSSRSYFWAWWKYKYSWLRCEYRCGGSSHVMIESNGLGLKKSQCSLLSGDIAWLILLVVDEGYRYRDDLGLVTFQWIHVLDNRWWSSQEIKSLWCYTNPLNDDWELDSHMWSFHSSGESTNKEQ